MTLESLEDFAVDFHQQINAQANIENEERFPETVFVERMIEYLHRAEELENGILCSHKSKGMKVDGYDLNTEENCITILVSQFGSLPPPPVPKLAKADIETAFKRASTFLSRSKDGYHDKLEDSAEGYDLAKLIHQLNGQIERAKIILLTNAITRKRAAESARIGNIEVGYQIWDIERLFRFVSSGMKKEPITVDFAEEFGAPLECISRQSGDGVYTTYLSVIAGEVLAALYDTWGTRLLERNVRSFLQARGKVNRGIRDTIVGEPAMFLAYNNGITVTGDYVELEPLTGGGLGIKKVRDFQIVNGGQTTASLWHTKRKNKASLQDVWLQMKLTVLADPQQIEVIAPKISKYSNTQNKVSTADFSANDPFHISLEKVSRTTWAPDPTGGGRQTMWFYERARGSYDETRNRERTAEKIRTWDSLNPRKQCFDKLMLAKVEETWELRPYMVSRGSQKNFLDFTIELRERGVGEVGKEYFQDVVSRLILWKAAERVVSAQNIPGYRANIVTYSISWLVFLTGNRVDLARIWKNQSVGENINEFLGFLADRVRKHITSTDYNVTEWCKQEKCWESLIKQQIELPSRLSDSGELLDTSKPTAPTIGQAPNPEEQGLIEWTKGVKAEVWLHISHWGRVTKSLETWENGIAYSIGNRMKGGKDPTARQAVQGKKIYGKAEKLGFRPDMDADGS